MHHVAGDDRLLALRAHHDAAMAGRMAGRRDQREGFVELKGLIDQESLTRFDDRPAIVAPGVARQASPQHAWRRLVARGHRLPMRILVLVEDVLGFREGRRPPAVAKHRVPARVVEMEMRAEDVGDVLKPESRRTEIVEPGLLGEVIGRGEALVLAGAGVDQNCMPGRTHEKRLVGDHHPSACGVEHDRVESGQVFTPDLGIIGREHGLGRPPRTVALDQAGDRDLAELQRLHKRSPRGVVFASPSPTDGAGARWRNDQR